MLNKKEQKINLSELQTQRAFWVSITTGVVMLLILALLLITDSGREWTGRADVRAFVAGLTLSSFISAWLARRGRAVLGISLILAALYISVFWTALSITNIGVALAAVTLTLTFGITSMVMYSTWLAKYANIVSVILSAAVILLDIFQPFPRAANNTPIITWGITIFLVLVYGYLVLRQFSSYTIRTKLTIAFLAAAVIPLALLAFINDRNTRNALTNQGNQALLSAASQTTAQLDTFINNNLDIIRTQANLPDFRSYLSLPAAERADGGDEIVSILSTFARQNSIYISSIAIYDINGKTLVDTYTDDLGTDKSDRNYFTQAVETGLPYVSNVEFSETTDEASIYFSAPVRNTSGDIIGVLRTRYNAAILQDIISSNNNLLGPGSFAMLVDAQSHVRLAHGTTPSIIFKAAVPLSDETIRDLQLRRLLPPGSPEDLSTNLPEFEAVLNNYKTQPFFLTELKINDNSLEQGAIFNSKTEDWHIIYAQDQETFLAPITAQTHRNTLLTIFITLMVSGFAVLISTTVAGPIVRLTKVAETIAGGDFNVQAKVETGDEIGTLAQTFNRMTQQLSDFITSLEERVAARTKDLATVAEVGTATSSILETNRLLQEVVDLTKDRFNLYHSHIYLLDETSQNLVLTAGAGEPGRIMAAEKRSIPLSREQSLVARAAREGKGVTVNDVTKAADFLPNPLLPNTRSELAVPMIAGGKVIGVFDIQSDVIGRFTDSDVNIQTTLAAQVATSIQNVRAFEQSKAQADLEALVNAIGQKIQRATTVEDTLQTAIRELGSALGATRVSANIQASRENVTVRES